MLPSKKKSKVEDKLMVIKRRFKSITNDPKKFLDSNNPANLDSLTLVRNIYQLAVESDDRNKNSVDILPELFFEDLDEEQIWQQLELRNNLVCSQFLKNVADILSIKEEKLEFKTKNEIESMSDDDNVVSQESNQGITDSDNKKKETRNKGVTKTKARHSLVDDKFFKLREMEEFLVSEDLKELKKRNKLLENEMNINYFDDNFSDESAADNIEYKDFFDSDENNESDSDINSEKINGQKAEVAETDDEVNNIDCLETPQTTQFAEEILRNHEKESSSNNSENNEVVDQQKSDLPKSTFEMRQDRLNQHIKDYEEVLLGDKPWQLTGEIQAGNRPRNSLLEQILEFDANTRPTPIITEETTKKLEDIIKQRIKDQAWDDVERTLKPVNTPREYKKQLVIDQEKSKQSLAQIYEQEYKEKVFQNSEQLNTESPIPKEHQEISSMMTALFLKLDALSNFHFTPKPAAPETRIITNTPAVNMEEVAPIAVSDVKLLAPEEVQKPSKVLVLGKSERTKLDKNRDRRHKKQKQKAIKTSLEQQKVQKGHADTKTINKMDQVALLKKLTKNRNVKNLSSCEDQRPIKSSRAFFSKLRDTVSVPTIKHTKKNLN